MNLGEFQLQIRVCPDIGQRNHLKRDYTMEYLKVEWIHQNDLYSVVLYSELDDNRMEVRKIEVYREGKADTADHGTANGTTELSIEPLPSIKNISSDSQFLPIEMSRDEFEAIWIQSTITQN